MWQTPWTEEKWLLGASVIVWQFLTFVIFWRFSNSSWKIEVWLAMIWYHLCACSWSLIDKNVVFIIATNVTSFLPSGFSCALSLGWKFLSFSLQCCWHLHMTKCPCKIIYILVISSGGAVVELSLHAVFFSFLLSIQTQGVGFSLSYSLVVSLCGVLVGKG